MAVNPYINATTNQTTDGIQGTFDFSGFYPLPPSPVYNPIDSYNPFVQTIVSTEPTQFLASLKNVLWQDTFLQSLKAIWENNPLDGIVAVGYTFDGGNYEYNTDGFKIGKVQFPIACNHVRETMTQRYLGHLTIKRKYGNFLDFEPFTKISLHIPNCGNFELTPSNVVGDVGFDMYMINDVSNGNYYIYGVNPADGSLVLSASGNFWIPIELSSRDYSTNVSGMIKSVPSLVGGLISGNQLQMIGGASSFLNSLWQPPQMDSLRYNNANTAYMESQTIYAEIVSPKYSLPIDYINQNGLPCNKTLQIGKCNGFTQISSINWRSTLHSSRTPTTQIIEKITGMLKTGIYILGGEQ